MNSRSALRRRGVDQTTPDNCLQAVVATALAVPIEAVPSFHLFGPNWRPALDLFLDGAEFDGPAMSIAVGMSARDTKHCVLCVDGEMVWDPHPDRSGLVWVDYTIPVRQEGVPADE